jgi:hypothetical protein
MPSARIVAWRRSASARTAPMIEVIVAVGVVAHETHVELDHVGFDERQQRQRRWISADVVERNAHPRGACRADRPDQCRGVVEQGSFGDFEHDIERGAGEPTQLDELRGNWCSERCRLDVDEQLCRPVEACGQRTAQCSGTARPIELHRQPFRSPSRPAHLSPPSTKGPIGGSSL